MQRTTTSTEFLEWVAYLHREEYESHSKLDYYLAQIAAEIRSFRSGFSKTPKHYTPKELLLQFAEETPTAPVDTEEALRPSKSSWASLFGVSDLSELAKNAPGDNSDNSKAGT